MVVVLLAVLLMMKSNSDSLDLNEMRWAFEQVYDLPSGNPSIDIIGFDACLMATVDVASTFSDIVKYMVASEDLEPGYGWNYEDWLEVLSYNPSIDPKNLGVSICDSYYDFYEDWGMDDEITLSLVDLTNIEPLLNAYDYFGQEALMSAVNDPNFLVKFVRNANEAENSGGNNRYDGYTNMVDLGSLAYANSNHLPDSTMAVLNALEDCVLYNVTGEYRQGSSGLFCYYSFNGDIDDFLGYKQVGCSENFINYYSYSLGELDYIDEDYLDDNDLDIFDFDFPLDLNEVDPYDYDVYLNEDDYAVLEVGYELAEAIADIYYNICYFDVENDLFVALGADDVGLIIDYENGIFTENFDHTWGAIDGHYIYMEPIGYGEDFYMFSSPIMLNDELYSLHLVYDFGEEEYKILGASQGISDNGMAQKNLRKLQSGDEITILFYASSLSSYDDEVELTSFETFTVYDNPVFEYIPLGDGQYVLSFEIYDYQNELFNPWTSVFIDVVDGNMYPELMEY